MKNKLLYLFISLFIFSACGNNTKEHTCTISNDYGGYEVIISEDNDVVSKEEYTLYYNENYLIDYDFTDFRSAYNHFREYYLDELEGFENTNFDAYYTSDSVVVKFTLDFNSNSIDDLNKAGLVEEDQIYKDHISYSASTNLFGLNCEDK